MKRHDLVIRNARIFDGTGAEPVYGDLAIHDGIVAELGTVRGEGPVFEAEGMALSPGFVDVHTHDDLAVIRKPEMLPKLSQGVTTVVTGNCGISAAPVYTKPAQPDPMNLLGPGDAFVYPRFADYKQAIATAQPAVNVAALVGHTALRSNHMDDLKRVARPDEIDDMRRQLDEALDEGALGLSTGLAYASAFSSDTDEVVALAETLHDHGAVYTSHIRNEFESIIEALNEAFDIGSRVRVPVVVSHLKCAGMANWGRTAEVLRHIEKARQSQVIGFDCYPYTAGSSTLDLKQVTADFDILITWSEPHPEIGGKTLKAVAALWGLSLMETARKLQPAGAVYHNMAEEDMQRVLSHPASMIGSDGLPEDPRPHPRLWGTFPRVLGHYARDLKLFSLAEAIRKMTGLPAARFGLEKRGTIAEGNWADLVLFDPNKIRDTAVYGDSIRPSEGIEAVWVNGGLSYRNKTASVARFGRFVERGSALHRTFT